MKTYLRLTNEPIDETALNASRAAVTNQGAVLCFQGLVRDAEAGETIRAIDYEAFREMAEHQFQLLFSEMARRWPMLESTRVVHRLGVVPAGQSSLWVEIIAPHRGEAFAACQWLIDEMKQVVPIWKHPLAP